MKENDLASAMSTMDMAASSGSDLSSSGDLASTSNDLASGGQLGCRDLVGCVYGCTSANASTCVPACLAQARSTTSRNLFDALQACAEPACATQRDGGPPPCSDPSASACADCVTSSCSAQYSDCLADR